MNRIPPASTTVESTPSTPSAWRSTPYSTPRNHTKKNVERRGSVPLKNTKVPAEVPK
jgi:hypothetical protein